MKFSYFINVIRSDAFRYSGKTNFLNIIKLYFRIAGFNYSCKMRLTLFLSQHLFVKPLFIVSYFLYRRAMYKYGICIPYKTKIGKGLYIGHFGGIVINSDVVIGKNCNISHGVTIGEKPSKGARSCPIIGDNVYIGPNSTIVGDIRLGSRCVVGANAFVDKSVREDEVVVGVPARHLSFASSADYVHNTWNE